MPLYERNQDDVQSDPELIAARHRIGRSIFFEVELSLSEQRQKEQTIKDQSRLNMALGYESNPITTNYGYNSIFIDAYGNDVPYGCPFIEDYILVGEKGQLPRPILAKSLVSRGSSNYSLYNPITKNFNKVKSARIIYDSPLLRVKTSLKDIGARFSTTHKIIRNASDLVGQSMVDHVLGSELVVTKREKSENKVNFNIYIDSLVDILYNPNLRGDVVEIELETEYIYASGTEEDEMILGHNRKDDYNSPYGVSLLQ